VQWTLLVKSLDTVLFQPKGRLILVAVRVGVADRYAEGRNE
jgi:hypothetical protein